MDWRIKAVIQKALSFVPGGVRANDFLQKTVGGLRKFNAEVAMKVGDWSLFMTYLRELDFPINAARSLEVGTGWFPTLPVCFSLAGVADCATFDLSRHLSDRLSMRLLRELEGYLPLIAAAAQRPMDHVRATYDRFAMSVDSAELLRSAGIRYLAPADATATGITEESIDVVYSNSVLEHVPHRVIAELMRESFRLLRPGGIIVHGVNCGDHYAYFDRRITPINYLTYSAEEWQHWNSSILYQNRLRPRDFLALAENAGFEIVLRKQRARQELLSKLPDLKLSAEFCDYPPEEICCTSIDFVAKKKGLIVR